VPLDTLEIAAPADAELDALFDREWVRSVLDHALVSLHARAESEGRTAALAVFRARDLEVADGDTPPTYAALATTFGIPPTQVTNHLNWARRAFRSEVLTTLRSLTTSEDDFRSEARALLGVDAA
jgi:hypothetical protein